MNTLQGRIFEPCLIDWVEWAAKDVYHVDIKARGRVRKYNQAWVPKTILKIMQICEMEGMDRNWVPKKLEDEIAISARRWVWRRVQRLESDSTLIHSTTIKKCPTLLCEHPFAGETGPTMFGQVSASWWDSEQQAMRYKDLSITVSASELLTWSSRLGLNYGPTFERSNNTCNLLRVIFSCWIWQRELYGVDIVHRRKEFEWSLKFARSRDRNSELEFRATCQPGRIWGRVVRVESKGARFRP